MNYTVDLENFCISTEMNFRNAFSKLIFVQIYVFSFFI